MWLRRQNSAAKEIRVDPVGLFQRHKQIRDRQIPRKNVKPKKSKKLDVIPRVESVESMDSIITSCGNTSINIISQANNNDEETCLSLDNSNIFMMDSATELYDGYHDVTDSIITKSNAQVIEMENDSSDVANNKQNKKKQIPWRKNKEGTKFMLTLANIIYMNNGHQTIHGATEEVWESICHEFHQEDIMQGQEPVLAKTLRKKYESMLTDRNLMWVPTTDGDLEVDDEDMSDELILKKALYVMKKENSEMKVNSAKEREAKKVHREELEKISSETIAKGMTVRHHGVITTPSSDEIASTSKKPRRDSLDDIIINLLSPVVSASSTTPNKQVNFVMSKYKDMSKVRLNEGSFLKQCGLDEQDINALNLSFHTVGVIINLYKEFHGSMKEFVSNGKDMLELSPAVLSIVYVYLSSLNE